MCIVNLLTFLSTYLCVFIHFFRIFTLFLMHFLCMFIQRARGFLKWGYVFRSHAAVLTRTHGATQRGGVKKFAEDRARSFASRQNVFRVVFHISISILLRWALCLFSRDTHIRQRSIKKGLNLRTAEDFTVNCLRICCCFGCQLS